MITQIHPTHEMGPWEERDYIVNDTGITRRERRCKTCRAVEYLRDGHAYLEDRLRVACKPAAWFEFINWVPVHILPRYAGPFLVKFEESGMAGRPYVSTAWWSQNDYGYFGWHVDWDEAVEQGFTITHYAYLE